MARQTTAHPPEHALHCPRCETIATPGARFCRQCGVRLGTEAPPPHGDDASGPPAARDTTDDAGPPASRDTTDDAGPSPDRAAPGPGGGRAGGPGTAAPDAADTAVIGKAGVVAEARRSCPSCGAPNSPLREVCGRCGADLETGGALPQSTEEEPVGRPPADPAPAPGRRLLPVLFGTVLLVGLVVLGLGLAGLGPFAQQVGMPDAEFAAEEYGGDPGALTLTDIAARTTLEARGEERLDPSQMADANPDTAWNNDGGQLEHGIGEVIDLFLAEPAWVQRIVITNGYQRDADTYAAHGRVKRAAIHFDGDERVVANLLDLGLERQAVELPEPRLTTTVRIEVLEAFPGDTYPDLAVSDLDLEGWSAHGADAEVAVERAEVRRAAGPTRD